MYTRQPIKRLMNHATLIPLNVQHFFCSQTICTRTSIMRQKLAGITEHSLAQDWCARNSFINYRGQFSGGYDAMSARAHVTHLQIDPATQSEFILDRSR